MFSKSLKRSYTFSDVKDSQIGSGQYFLNTVLNKMTKSVHGWNGRVVNVTYFAGFLLSKGHPRSCQLIEIFLLVYFSCNRTINGEPCLSVTSSSDQKFVKSKKVGVRVYIPASELFVSADRWSTRVLFLSVNGRPLLNAKIKLRCQLNCRKRNIVINTVFKWNYCMCFVYFNMASWQNVSVAL